MPRSLSNNSIKSYAVFTDLNGSILASSTHGAAGCMNDTQIRAITAGLSGPRSQESPTNTKGRYKRLPWLLLTGHCEWAILRGG
jgi:hypothetical protein